MKALNFDYLHQCNVATNCAMQGESKGEFLTQLEAHNRELAQENAELKAQVERLIHDHDRHEYHPRGVGGCSICEASRKRIAARAGRK